MSSVKRSGARSTSRNPVKFKLDDVNSLLSSKDTATAAPQSVHHKTSAKRKREVDTEKDLKDLEKNLLENVTEVFSTIRAIQNNIHAYHDTALKEAGSVISVKDVLIAQLTGEKKNLEDELGIVNLKAQERILEAADDAKVWGGRAVLEARIKMAEQAMDPVFDKSAWDIESWKKNLAELKEDDDMDEAGESKDGDAGTSGAKDPEGRVEGEEAKDAEV